MERRKQRPVQRNKRKEKEKEERKRKGRKGETADRDETAKKVMGKKEVAAVKEDG